LNIAEIAREDIDADVKPLQVLINLCNQCLKRDSGWKAFYTEQMDLINKDSMTSLILDLFELELEAEIKYQEGDYDGASSTIQNLIDKYKFDKYDIGWYLQEMARFIYPKNKVESNKLQLEAHKHNRLLLKPIEGMQVNQIKMISQKRMENIISWMKKFSDFNELYMSLKEILGNLTFGTKPDRFEDSFNKLSEALGFKGERPDKEWKEGPDNLWALADGEYLLVECKNDVQLTRSEINKKETEQMNSSCDWFMKTYPGAKCCNLMIIPTKKLSRSAAFRYDVKIMTDRKLSAFVKNVASFFREFKDIEFNSLSEKHIQSLIDAHMLSVESIISKYADPVYKSEMRK